MKYKELRKLADRAERAKGEERELLLQKHKKLKRFVERMHKAEGDAKVRLMEKISEEMPKLAEEIASSLEFL